MSGMNYLTSWKLGHTALFTFEVHALGCWHIGFQVSDRSHLGNLYVSFVLFSIAITSIGEERVGRCAGRLLVFPRCVASRFTSLPVCSRGQFNCGMQENSERHFFQASVTIKHRSLDQRSNFINNYWQNTAFHATVTWYDCGTLIEQYNTSITERQHFAPSRTRL